jgi:hypothetical protein
MRLGGTGIRLPSKIAVAFGMGIHKLANGPMGSHRTDRARPKDLVPPSCLIGAIDPVVNVAIDSRLGAIRE